MTFSPRPVAYEVAETVPAPIFASFPAPSTSASISTFLPASASIVGTLTFGRFDGKLFATRLYYCVTHSFTSPFGFGAKSSISRKVQIIRTRKRIRQRGRPVPGYCRKSYGSQEKPVLLFR
jgi:hypothetical protein